MAENIIVSGALLALSFIGLLVGAEIFTNGVEWLGRRLGVGASATGSILAAVGTALPETLIPVIAIINGVVSGDTSGADEVGVGAILGAPFMLTTIAMFLLGIATFYYRTQRQSGQKLSPDIVSTERDLRFFLVGYTMAFGVAILQVRIIEILVGVVLVLLYLYYLYDTLQNDRVGEEEELEDLYLGQIGAWLRNNTPVGGRLSSSPATSLIVLQTLLALAIIIGGAHLFVGEVEFFAEDVLKIPTAVLSLLIAPLATELPEKFNSVIWISESKDTLALGNITGAMAFQGTLPVTLGILFTSWNLSVQWGTTGFLNGFSALLAILAGLILYARTRRLEGSEYNVLPFLIGGVFYLLFLGVVVYHVIVLGVGA